MTYFDFHHHHIQRENGIYNLRFNETVPFGLFSAGIHPNDAGWNIPNQFDWLEEISKHKNCVAIGECGLDGLIDVNNSIQEDVFNRQIELANERNKPLIIHCVRRFSQLIPLKKKAKVPMIVHGFNKRKTVGEELQKHQFYLSFGKTVLHHVNLQQFVKDFPLEKLFLETDDDDFNLQELYQKVAELKGITIEELQEKMKENLKIFNISTVL
ncbi:TatD family hydrolase [Kaistella carnis]|uniref:Hydrolase TatD n=1 Tax=Kaistella carnis TaxID=1241979 RepID=A0A3G8XJK2_9FLAO|nr:TatD family hydrolase [Kaistella carnis]AZI33695.1 hydrolase TatD [Kaistella carnis]